MPSVLVINPNSSVTVTDAIARSIEASPASAHGTFRSETMAEGPPGIITQDDWEVAKGLVTTWLDRRADDADAFVIACFSDPGVPAERAIGDKPVIGIGEAGIRAALRRGKRVGVIAIADPSIPRHMRYWKALGLDRHVVGERALNLRVDQSGDHALAFEPMLRAGRLLREDGADVLLLGCAGMSDLRQPLEDALGIPVVDPCEAGAEEAIRALG